MKAPIYADLDQIVFEGRPQDYGAYEMRKKYNRILTRAMLMAFLMFISLTGLPKILEWVRPAEVVEPDEMVTITEIDANILPKTIDEPEDLPEPIEVEKPQGGPLDVETVRFAEPVPVRDDMIRDEETIAAVADFDSAAVALEDHDGDAVAGYNWSEIGKGNPFDDGDLVLEGEGEGDGEDDDDHKKFILLEKEPKPVNMDELAKLIGYPAMAKEVGIEGKVTLRVKVDKQGQYVRHVILKDPHPILTKAVTDKISHLVCTPGIQAGKPIPVWVTIPFNFELKQ